MTGIPHAGVRRITAAVAALLVAAAGPAASAAAATGRIHTVAGAGFFVGRDVAVPPPNGDGGPAALARIAFPTAVAATPDGGFLIADGERNRIRRVSPRGVISTVAGTGRAGSSGDGGPATAARLDFPTGVARLGDGAVAIADQRNNRVRLVNAGGTISTLATARFPDGLAAAPDGGVLVAESLNNRILHVDRTGVVTVVAGTGQGGSSGDGGPATAALLSRPRGVAPTRDGGFLIADGSGGGRVRRVAPDGTITTAATVSRPAAVAEEPDGAILVASVNQIRRIRTDGMVVTIAGTGQGNFSGDGGPAGDATLWLPRGVAALAGGGILVADTDSGRVRFIDSSSPGPSVPGTPRFMAASLARRIQRGEAAIVTHLRVKCPPRNVAVRFALARPATVSLVVTRLGRTVARPGARLGAGAHTFRFRVGQTGEHVLQLSARDGLGRVARDQAQLTVSACGG
jgi:glucose/arabinose dehydrogenase